MPSLPSPAPHLDAPEPLTCQAVEGKINLSDDASIRQLLGVATEGIKGARDGTGEEGKMTGISKGRGRFARGGRGVKVELTGAEKKDGRRGGRVQREDGRVMKEGALVRGGGGGAGGGKMSRRRRSVRDRRKVEVGRDEQRNGRETKEKVYAGIWEVEELQVERMTDGKREERK